jgi:hypothetical protein
MKETSDVSIERYYVYILVHATKARIPFKLIHYEYFINKKDAKAREEYLKSGHGREQLRNFLKSTLVELAT